MTVELQAITMPKWGLAMDEGMVVDWHVEEGARLGIGDAVVDIETTKITNALESPAGGILCRRLVAEGETVPVGALLGVIAAGAAEAAEIAAGTAEIDAFIARFEAAFAVAAAEAATETASAPEIVEAAGWRLNYQRAGEGAGGSETAPIVLVHGFGGDLNTWLFNQPDLAETHAVYALDLPGHGRSGKDVGAGDLAALSGALGAFLDALGIGRAHLCGHSLGAAVALDLALGRPAAVASLTLIAPVGLGPEINMAFIDGFIAAGRRKEMKAVLQMLFADPQTVGRDMVEEVLRYKRLDGVEAALRGIAGAVFPGGRQGTVLAERLSELAQPVQVIRGREDRILPPAQAEGLPANVAVTMIENAGHMPQMEAAAEVNRLIRKIAG
ncbi:MAG: acetoin dehydrogenase dihydrolipoyllysine-residue acetyltransferase subunit [Proteobacteria bacterium]|nr:acetoin dehydrogenase dihydrolipoyllysine-residue acetyltransferase subunit [Pseudomonadota bacterium]